MTMRQIQDLTFSVARGLDQVDSRLRELRGSFVSWADRIAPTAYARFLGVHIVCVPGGQDCYLDQVHNIDQVRPRQRNVRLQVRDGLIHEIQPPFDVHQWSPILRGSEGFGSSPSGEARLQVHCDGAIVYDWRRKSARAEDENDITRTPHFLHVDWLFAMIVNALESADRFRNYVGASATEYAIEMHLFASQAAPVVVLGGRTLSETNGKIDPGLQRYPRYALGLADSWPDTLTRIWHDFWNSIHTDASGHLLRLVP